MTWFPLLRSLRPGSYSWLVVDQAMVDASSVIQGYIKKGYTADGR